ncbi:response regulator [Nonomuraea sp. NPDC049421]|uniref:response regulator n=1 Tax=Nonomuraea sp. NPDC049421 TaxID=3155275 RepID=UPI003420374D
MSKTGDPQVRHILVVDDDRTLNHACVDRLCRVDGAAATSAYDGRTALGLIGEQRPDLVLLDLGLPDMDGFDVLLRSRHPHRYQPDVIVMTADNDGRKVLRALRAGALSYLLKPFTMAVLSAAVRAVWQAHSTIAALDDHPSLVQGDIDHVMSTLRLVGLGGRDYRAPKGIAQSTLTMVRQALAAAPTDMSAGEVAVACGLSRASARRYLQHLHAVGLATERQRYGRAGRPEHRYTSTER